jgi:2-isopropylmalate synthase
MVKNPATKYPSAPFVHLPDRRWPSKVVDSPPIWCAVDLRDGNQALIEPMDPARKLRMFEMLVRLGFKEIEIGFPAASQTDFDFCRELVEKKLIPQDVTLQVLVQAREHLMRPTFEAIKGVHRAIVHVYNSTSILQRDVVFRMDKPAIKEIAVNGARMLRDYAVQYPETEWMFEYSPESFTGTEVDYAVEVCEAVMDVWQPTPEKKVILNLPSTVELATPNVYADQIEWVSRNIKQRDSIVLSVHPHNDRGTGVAAAELAMMAGADRVEGTLFGNGERTGNVDIVTLALNLYAQGVDPKLDFSNISEAIECAEYCNQLPVHARHPYAGELVFTAFSGSHQDAIKKGFDARSGEKWAVPYLLIDPRDIGRNYEAIIRINSQSGKGGVAYLLERDYGIKLPRKLQIEFSRLVQRITEKTGGEISSHDIWSTFNAEYIDRQSPLAYRRHWQDSSTETSSKITVKVREGNIEHTIQGEGSGPIDAFVDAVRKGFGVNFRLVDYQEHALGNGADATAVSFVEIRNGGEASVFGVGMHKNIVTASLDAILAAVNRALAQGVLTRNASPKQAAALRRA